QRLGGGHDHFVTAAGQRCIAVRPTAERPATGAALPATVLPGSPASAADQRDGRRQKVASATA
ncbi:MAG: hypothetical protein ABWZ02_13940, partial [Nakamurella sp.]